MALLASLGSLLGLTLDFSGATLARFAILFEVWEQSHKKGPQKSPK